MAVFRGKSIDAWQVGASPMPDWVPDIHRNDPSEDEDSNYVEIRATKGVKVVYVDDWVIKDGDGTVRTMADEKFKLRYDAVPERSVLHAIIGGDEFELTDAQLKEIRTMINGPISGSQQLRADSTRQTTQPTEANASNTSDTVKTLESRGVPIPQRLQESTGREMQNRSAQQQSARPTVHKHKPGEYND